MIFKNTKYTRNKGQKKCQISRSEVHAPSVRRTLNIFIFLVPVVIALGQDSLQLAKQKAYEEALRTRELFKKDPKRFRDSMNEIRSQKKYTEALERIARYKKRIRKRLPK
jgi:hypothetical protein